MSSKQAVFKCMYIMPFIIYIHIFVRWLFFENDCMADNSEKSPEIFWSMFDTLSITGAYLKFFLELMM